MEFKHFPAGSAVGTGDYVFRHFGSEQPVELPYLCFTAQEANSSVALTKIGTLSKGQAFETSTDENTWTAYTFGDVISLPSLGDKVYFRGDNVALGEGIQAYCTFHMTGTIAASGNIMSLLDKTCELRSLSMAAAYCFYHLFSGCTSLVTAPELPATTLAGSCYRNMFSGCTSLSSICVSFATWFNCTGSWVVGVATSGTFRCPSALPDERGVDKIPEGWTIIHTDA